MNTRLSGKTNDTTDGAQAESIAAAYLLRQGLRIEARNFRVRGGEIDLVCRDGRNLVFVEVRLRRHAAFGGAGGSITAAKRRRIILAARHYLSRTPEAPCRFDCVLLSGLDDRHVEWIRDAFSADPADF